MSERKTVFITGASRGIGHATANYFVQRGWRAITCSRDEVPPECPRDERHEHITVDLELTRELPGTVERLHNILGGQKLHALVNNAGYSPKAEGGKRLGCLDSDMAVWQQTFAINFFAPVYFSRACAPLLAESGGSIVNITSIAGHRVHPFAGSAYSTSKAALTGLTRELAADLAHLGIRANAVCPGEINTAIL
ncbi:MAG: SDR family oxidoreductase, partial [Geminicoccaceae bacterium]